MTTRWPWSCGHSRQGRINDVEATDLDEAYQRVETGTKAQRAGHSPIDELLNNTPTRRVGGSPAAIDLPLQRGSLELILVTTAITTMTVGGHRELPAGGHSIPNDGQHAA
jgi:hypothetical protein